MAHVSEGFFKPNLTWIMDKPTTWYKPTGQFLPAGLAKKTEVCTTKYASMQLQINEKFRK